jgi:hypothetical protein
VQKSNFQEKSQKILQKSYFTRRPTELEYETERGWEATTPPGGAAQAWPRQGVVRPPQPSPRALLPPTYTSKPETIGVSVLDTGVSRSTSSWAPSSAHLQPRGEPRTQATKKTLMRRRLMRRTTAETAKDQETSSRAPAGEERDQVHVSSARWRAEQEDEGQKTAYRPRYPRQGGDQLSLCLPKAAQWLLATPLKK